MLFGTTWIGALTDHLWQSTLFFVLAWLLTLALRHNQARTRFALWMLASLKFLVPFALLMTLGHHFAQAPRTHADASHAAPAIVEGAARSFAPNLVHADSSVTWYDMEPSSTATHHTAVWPEILGAVWAAGFLILLFSWTVQWIRMLRIARNAKPVGNVAGVPVLSTKVRLEPGIFGLVRPKLLLPAGILERLSPAQLDAVLAHEHAHVCRRDNVWAALHMVVKALFWFHPAVWWIGRQLIEERERACDEAVLQADCEAVSYAESILNVCKFYMETPLPCVAGVTGADLKKRIARIMAENVARKLDLGRKLLLMTAALLAVALPVTFGVVYASPRMAQDAAKQTGIEGTWQGTLHVARDLRTVLKISKSDKGDLSVAMYSIDQGPGSMGSTSASFADGAFKYAVMFIDGSYEGKLSADGNTITGTWTQGGQAHPLIFVRSTPATEWATQEAPPPLKPMATRADPSFEVATIKPSKPGEPGKLFGVRGNRFTTINTTLTDLICFAYSIQQKQVVSTQPWIDTDKYDIAAQPDTPGSPNQNQLKTMVRKLLTTRFQLKFHQDKRDMPAYVLSVMKGGPKFAKSNGDPTGLPGLFFTQLGTLTVRNATMQEFAGVMETAVFDRPVVDQTNLSGRWDFLLKWTPDESQFSGLGVKVPPPSDKPDAPPPLYTAIQDQLGLKLEAQKTSVPVVVIDHVEHPSAD